MDSRQRDIIRAAGKAQKKTDKAIHTCLVPGCSQYAIASHSQHRAGQLKAIEHENEVYAVEKNLYKALKKKRPIGSAPFTRTPIKKASTFPGFCPTHDNVIFKPIERTKLECGNEQQSALLFLRAHAFEYLQKQRAYIWNSYFLKEAQNLLSQESLENYHLRMEGINYFLTFDAPYYFKRLFEALTKNEYGGIKSAWVEIPKNILVSVSCCMSPLMHQHIDYMVEHQESAQPAVSFSVVPNQSSTHVAVSWLKEHSELSSWIGESLGNPKQLEGIINQSIFGESEDTCIAPILWESLSNAEQGLVAQAAGFTRELEIPAPVPRVVKL